MKKKVRINKLKLKNNVKYALLVLILLVGIIVFPSTLSRFQSNGNSDVKVDVAFSLLQTDELIETVALDEILPDGKTHEYKFSVKNYDDDGKRLDINLKYSITFKTTTNLPIKYELYDGNDKKLDVDFQIIQDEDGTYFNVFTTDEVIATYKEDVIETYTIKYSLDSIYNDASYQDMIELLSIEINVEQIM